MREPTNIPCARVTGEFYRLHDSTAFDWTAADAWVVRVFLLELGVVFVGRRRRRRLHVTQ
jgi:hypothetical protein